MADSPPQLRLRIGPGVRLETATGVRDFTEFQRALILLLADAGRSGVGRNRASTLLWDDSGVTVTTPRRRLRQLIYGLNRRSGMNLVVADSERIALSPQADVVWLGESLAERVPAPTRAFEMVRDEIEGRSVQRSRADLISVLDAARAEDDPERVLNALRGASDVSSQWRNGVWALLRSGRIREAESSIRELGIEDEEVLEKCRLVLSRLLAGNLATANEPSATAPLVGRIRELGEVTRAIQTGDTRIAVVGPNGVGLSRLLGAASAWTLTEMDDLVIASARCTATGRSMPYDTLNRLFDSDLFRAAYAEMEEPWKSVVARVLVRAIGDEPSVEIPRLEGTSATLRVLHGIAGLIEKAVGRAQLLAVIDDLHHADAASLTVLIHLGYEGDGPIVRMLASVRTDTDASSPIEGFLAKEARVVRVPPLSPDDSARLVQELYSEVNDEDAAALAGLCDGFPRRIVEASRSVSEAGGHLPQVTLDQLLRRRVDDLTSVEQEVIALLSLLSGGADATLLMATSGVGTLQLAQAVGEMERRGLVREEANLLHVTSPFLRHRIAEGIPIVMQKALHERIARHLESRSPPPAAEVGHHLMLADLRDEAAGHLVEGAHHAASEEAFTVAIELMQQAREASSEGLPPAELDFWGELLEAEGQFGEAVEVYAGAEAGWGEAGSQEEALWSRLGWLRSGVLSGHHRGDAYRLASDLLAGSRGLKQPDAEALCIDLLFRVGDLQLSREITLSACGELLKARSDGNDSPLLHFVESRRAYIDDVEAATRAILLYYHSTEPSTPERIKALCRLVACGVLGGETSNHLVESALGELKGLTPATDRYTEALVLSNLGEWMFEREELEEAREYTARAQALIRGLSSPAHTLIRTNRAEIAIALSDLNLAESELSVLEAGSIYMPPRDRLMVDSIRARIALERGSIATATELVDRWRHVDMGMPIASFSTIMLEARVRVLALTGRREDALREIRTAMDRATALTPRFVPVLETLEREVLRT